MGDYYKTVEESERPTNWQQVEAFILERVLEYPEKEIAGHLATDENEILELYHAIGTDHRCVMFTKLSDDKEYVDGALEFLRRNNKEMDVRKLEPYKDGMNIIICYHSHPDETEVTLADRVEFIGYPRNNSSRFLFYGVLYSHANFYWFDKRNGTIIE